MKAFELKKESLNDLLRNVDNGKIQLPEFQRDWIWDDERIIALLSSVGKSFPIGVVMMLETGNSEYLFKFRTIEGVPERDKNPESLILDGQQRITSLYQSIFSGQVLFCV
ncbi:MAG: DUF262 domain-containing protein [Candidatus Kapaibacterium sp.]